MTAHHRNAMNPPTPDPDRLPELRGRFERLIAVAQAESPPPGHIQLADRLLDAVVAWRDLWLPYSAIADPSAEP
jgi:hypothetical protein